MNEDSQRLSWSFWVAAFAPAIAAAAIDTIVATRLHGMNNLNTMMGAGTVFGVVLNLICPPLAGMRFAKYRRPTTWRVIQAAAYALLFS
jgi:hypothetical protein